MKGTLWLDSEETVFCFEYGSLGRRKIQKIFLKGRKELQITIYVAVEPVVYELA